MIKIPQKVDVANFPTRIEKLERLSKQLGGPELYIKRDDQTGSEISGNKVRKNEFLFKEAMNMGCGALITCGGIQSNHARSTAAMAARLGLEAHLVLRSDGVTAPLDGNYFLDQLLGAKISFMSADEYGDQRMEIMEQIREQLEREGKKAYVIPEGASNGLGVFGYYLAMEEIVAQQARMSVRFDAIVVAVGSGGTYGGLFLGNKASNNGARIFGFNVCRDKAYFEDEIDRILREALAYVGGELAFTKEEFNIIDGYVGEGYALSSPEELDFIRNLAQSEGVILDPVYTGKAMLGLVKEIKKGTFKEYRNILFIHTGGVFGLFPKKSAFVFDQGRCR